MIEGPSGIRSLYDDDEERPIYVVSRRRLEWPGDRAVAFAFSAEDPDSLRGPQFDLAWCDEAGAWKRAEATWDMLRFGMRIGLAPKTLVTTTPRPTGLIRRLVKLVAASLAVMTQAPSRANAGNLSPGFVEELEAMYAGTVLARQELEGELIDERPGALFTRAGVEGARITPRETPAMERVVVAVDPPASSGPRANACGIVAAGLAGGRVYVLEDASVQGASPLDWARRAVATARLHGAGRVLGESNQGGEMVRTMLAIAAQEAGAQVRVELRRADRTKRDRAEPVSAWINRGEVLFVGEFRELEDELCAFGAEGSRSPDRVDAMVWAVSELMGAPKPLPRARAL
jgi:phage terminase large subunit-like protein